MSCVSGELNTTSTLQEVDARCGSWMDGWFFHPLVVPSLLLYSSYTVLQLHRNSHRNSLRCRPTVIPEGPIPSAPTLNHDKRNIKDTAIWSDEAHLTDFMTLWRKEMLYINGKRNYTTLSSSLLSVFHNKILGTLPNIPSQQLAHTDENIPVFHEYTAPYSEWISTEWFLSLVQQLTTWWQTCAFSVSVPHLFWYRLVFHHCHLLLSLWLFAIICHYCKKYPE